MKEKWRTIEEFPDYQISNYGQVKNVSSGKILKESETRTGLVKIGFFVDGERYTRSVALLVAQAFVLGRNDIFNTPIHLDGDHRNNRADNLMWRPRWFAWKHAQQFDGVHTKSRNERPIRDVARGVWYTNVLEAVTINGLLIKDVMLSTSTQTPVFPTHQIFSFSE